MRRVVEIDPVLVPDLCLSVEQERRDGVEACLARSLGLTAEDIAAVELQRRSLDARRRRFTVRIRALVTLRDAGARARALSAGAEPAPPAPDDEDSALLRGLRPGSEALEAPPVIVGCGPAGLFAAWLLGRYGYRPIVLERGRAVQRRVRDVRSFEGGGAFDPESNILFGEGGAGTFSDGKLTCRTRSSLRQLILQVMVDCNAPRDILYQFKPHIGTDRLRAVLVHLRRRLAEDGVSVRFESRVDDLLCDGDGRLRAFRLASGEEIPCRAALLGIGHSARDTYRMLAERGLAMEAKPFQLGLRIEHPQELIDRFRYGRRAEELSLPTAEYALKTRLKAGPNLYSFCMCPGGTIVPSVSQPGFLCTNGMSRRKRDSGWANSGLVYTFAPPGGALAGVEAQEVIERLAYEEGSDYRVPAQRAHDFLAGRKSPASSLSSTYPLGHVPADLRALLPGDGPRLMRLALERFERQCRGFASKEAILVGPESRGSAPLRIVRDPETRASTSHPGLYPIGEGAGYAGGIISAALDGLRSARVIIERFAPLAGG